MRREHSSKIDTASFNYLPKVSARHKYNKSGLKRGKELIIKNPWIKTSM